MAARSLLEDNKQVQRAIALIGMGARLQLLQSETNLPYERLLKLYKEVAGRSPSKGQLPFSTDWFLSWQPNIHASLFLNIHEYLQKGSVLDEVEALMKAWQLYQAEVAAHGVEALLSITRAWRLVKFVDSGMLCLTRCERCGGQFVNHSYELTSGYVCGLCEPPARAGKGRREGSIH
jgi:flagellar transcriptional activator FlhC